MTVLSNNTFDVFFSSPWRVKWRKCVCPSLGFNACAPSHIIHPSFPGSAKKWNESQKKKEGVAEREGWFLPNPLPALSVAPFSPGLWLSFLVLCSETSRTLATLFTSCYGQLIALIWANFICFFWPVKSLWFHGHSHILYACFLTIFIIIYYYSWAYQSAEPRKPFSSEHDLLHNCKIIM